MTDDTYFCDDGKHAVVSVTNDKKLYRREPCEECPWRKDAPIGAFPPDAYIRSANTAYDMSKHTFACHMSGKDKPASCAGFLLRGANHNMNYRLALAFGHVEPDEIHSDVELYDSYRDMAVANGVDPDHPALKLCRSNDE